MAHHLQMVAVYCMIIIFIALVYSTVNILTGPRNIIAHNFTKTIFHVVLNVQTLGKMKIENEIVQTKANNQIKFSEFSTIFLHLRNSFSKIKKINKILMNQH